jgi:hypothetical protein
MSVSLTVSYYAFNGKEAKNPHKKKKQTQHSKFYYVFIFMLEILKGLDCS